MKRYASLSLFGIPLALAILPAPAFAGTDAIIGKWLAKAVTPNGPLELELEIKMDGTQLVGTMTGFQGAVPLTNVQFTDPDLSMEIALGGSTFKLTGVLKEGKFDGKYAQVGTDFQGTWTAEKRPVPATSTMAAGVAGAWDSVAVTANGELALALELKQEGDKLSGTLSSEMGSVPLQAASFAENKLQFDVEIGGNTYKVQADLKESKLEGKWSAAGGTDSGAWRAARKAAAPAATAASAAPAPAAILGAWDSIAVTPNGDLPAVLDLKQDGEKITGTLGSEMGTIAIMSPSFKEDKLQFEIEFGGGTYRIQADLKEDKLAGQWSAVGGTDSGAWTAKRKASAPAAAAASPAPLLDGAWTSVAVTPDGNSLKFQLELKQEGSVVTGNAVSPEGSIPLQKGTFAGNTLSFVIDFAGTAYRVDANLADGRFTGKWSAVSGTETGPWSAERKTAP